MEVGDLRLRPLVHAALAAGCSTYSEIILAVHGWRGDTPVQTASIARCINEEKRKRGRNALWHTVGEVAWLTCAGELAESCKADCAMQEPPRLAVSRDDTAATTAPPEPDNTPIVGPDGLPVLSRPDPVIRPDGKPAKIALKAPRPLPEARRVVLEMQARWLEAEIVDLKLVRNDSDDCAGFGFRIEKDTYTVLSVSPRSAAHRAGMLRNDVVVMVGYNLVGPNEASLQDILSERQKSDGDADKPFVLTVRRKLTAQRRKVKEPSVDTSSGSTPARDVPVDRTLRKRTAEPPQDDDDSRAASPNPRKARKA